MIHHAIAYITEELNDYLQSRSGPSSESRIVAASLFDLDGNVNNDAKGKIALSVVNVEEDRVYRNVELYARRADGKSELIQPEVKINLFVLFVANFSQYDEALKGVANVISFFQSRALFDYAEIQALAGRKGRIAAELFTMTFEQQNHLWGALGAKYMPSVMYKLGIVDVLDEQVQAEVPPVEEIAINE